MRTVAAWLIGMINTRLYVAPHFFLVSIRPRRAHRGRLHSCCTAKLPNHVIDVKVDRPLAHVYEHPRCQSTTFPWQPTLALQFLDRSMESRPASVWNAARGDSGRFPPAREKIIASQSTGLKVAFATAIRGDEQERVLRHLACRLA